MNDNGNKHINVEELQEELFPFFVFNLITIYKYYEYF